MATTLGARPEMGRTRSGPIAPDLSATIATCILKASAAVGHSHEVSYRDCVQMLRKMRACRTPDDWQAVPGQRKVGALCGKFGIDPTDLSLLGDNVSIPI